jgi:hypothetical protein
VRDGRELSAADADCRTFPIKSNTAIEASRCVLRVSSQQPTFAQEGAGRRADSP